MLSLLLYRFLFPFRFLFRFRFLFLFLFPFLFRIPVSRFSRRPHRNDNIKVFCRFYPSKPRDYGILIQRFVLPQNVTKSESFASARDCKFYVSCCKPKNKVRYINSEFWKTSIGQIQSVEKCWKRNLQWSRYIFVYCLYGYLVNGTGSQGCSLVVSNHSLDWVSFFKIQKWKVA